MNDEILAALVPVVVYWIGAGIYHLMAIRMKEHRLFTDEEERTMNIVSRRRVVMGVLLNQAMQLALTLLATNATQGRTMVAAPKLSLLRLARQLPVAMIIVDTWQYWWHRIGHESKFLYKHMHAMHHQLVVPYAYGAQYIHPIDSLLGDTLAAVVAISVSGMSPWTSAAFVSFVSLKGLDDHSGLWFPKSPLSLMFSNNAPFHSIHHQHKGIKHNYSTFFFVIWDLIMGTYMPFSVEERKGGGYQIIMDKDE